MANLKEIATAVAEKMDITKKDAEECIRTTFSTIAEAMKNEEVSIPGFGKFTVVERAAREGRNPQTGEVINIEASTAPKFKAAKALKDLIK